MGKLEAAPVYIPRREESPLPRIVFYFPLADEDQDVKAMLGIITMVPETPGNVPIPAAQRLHAELAALRQSVRRRYGDGSLIGQGMSIRRAFEQVKLAQSSTSPVLFVGENGMKTTPRPRTPLPKFGWKKGVRPAGLPFVQSGSGTNPREDSGRRAVGRATGRCHLFRVSRFGPR